MPEKFRLKRTKQCAKCPWKKSTNPHEIPDGYCEEKHRNLEGTIAEAGAINLGKTLPTMACHESPEEEQYMCVGWAYHQLGKGNNIALRLKMLNCENAHELKVFGEQHETFEDTVPTNYDHE